MLKKIWNKITIELVLGYIFLGCSIAHYTKDQIIPMYGTMIIAWILFTTDSILTELRRQKEDK